MAPDLRNLLHIVLAEGARSSQHPNVLTLGGLLFRKGTKRSRQAHGRAHGRQQRGCMNLLRLLPSDSRILGISSRGDVLVHPGLSMPSEEGT